MLAGFVKRVLAAVAACSLGAAGALAQNYDGSGIVKFGVFGQGTFADIGIARPLVGSASPDGFSGGVSAGYDLTFSRHMLLGVEIDGSFGDARDTANGTDYGFDYMLALRGRLGVYARPGWLLYGTAGVGFLGIEIQQPGIGNKRAETLTGFVGGAGMEIDWHHVLLFGEYLYGDYGDREFSINNVRHEINSVETHMFRLGMKFKVGHDYAHDDIVYGRKYDTLK